ncbi:MAG: hypothetical protein ACKV2U_03380 [Bryobacteraceae bacterium]
MIEVKTVLREPYLAFKPIPLKIKIVFALREIPGNSVPDFLVGVTAATAMSLGLPLVTRNRIRSYAVARNIAIRGFVWSQPLRELHSAVMVVGDIGGFPF